MVSRWSSTYLTWTEEAAKIIIRAWMTILNRKISTLMLEIYGLERVPSKLTLKKGALKMGWLKFNPFILIQ